MNCLKIWIPQWHKTQPKSHNPRWYTLLHEHDTHKSKSRLIIAYVGLHLFCLNTVSWISPFQKLPISLITQPWIYWMPSLKWHLNKFATEDDLFLVLPRMIYFSSTRITYDRVYSKTCLGRPPQMTPEWSHINRWSPIGGILNIAK